MIVFDSSTLILTAKIELLDVFRKNAVMEVAIPRAVGEECCGGKKTLDVLMIRKALDESRVKVMSVRNRKLVTKLEEDSSMARGESEAIARLRLSNASVVPFRFVIDWRHERSSRRQNGTQTAKPDRGGEDRCGV